MSRSEFAWKQLMAKGMPDCVRGYIGGTVRQVVKRARLWPTVLR